MIPLATLDAALVLFGAIAAGLSFLGILGLVLWALASRRDRRRKRAARRRARLDAPGPFDGLGLQKRSRLPL